MRLSHLCFCDKEKRKEKSSLMPLAISPNPCEQNELRTIDKRIKKQYWQNEIEYQTHDI
jgi:hypothetical protein